MTDHHAPRHNPVLVTFGVALACYLVVRGFVELFTIDWGDSASYAKDWGGPSLAGVLAVHCGPGLAALAAGGWALVRRTR